MSGNDNGAVLITGATGFLGSVVLAEFLDRTERPVYALVRADGEEHAQARLRKVMHTIYGDEDRHEGRIHAAVGQLRHEGLGLSERMADRISDEVEIIVHAAASVSFGLPLPTAFDINVGGTLQMLKLAERCRRLRRFAHTSTAFVAGPDGEVFRETDVLPVDWRNTYEGSKAIAEWAVRGAKLPTTILRPSIIVGESISGWTSSWNVIYPYVEMILRGQLKEIPADPRTTLDIVPVDFVARTMFEACTFPSPEQETLHLVAADRAITIGEFAAVLNDRFGCSVRVVPPDAPVRELATIAPYLTQGRRFANDATRAALGIPGPPSLDRYIDVLVEFAWEANFGKTPISRTAARERVQR
jgi:long-chain acyl-CoA synthetase